MSNAAESGEIVSTSLKTLMKPISNAVTVRNALKVNRRLIEGYMKCSLFFRGAWSVTGKVNIRALARGNEEFFNGKDIGIFLAYVKSQ